MIAPPSTIRAGDTVRWRADETVDNFGNAVTSANWSLQYFFRSNTAGEGATITATAAATGWEAVIPAATSSGFDAGQWFWQAIATSGDDRLTLGAGQITVLAALDYIGAPDAFDGRTQAEQDLAAVQAAIRALINGGGVKEYTIGSRSIKKYELKDLVMIESQLKAQVKREQAAQLMANGLGSPHNLFVRF